MTSFLLLHGWGGNSPDHWQNYLAERLLEEDQSVIYPHFPNAEVPIKEEWIETLEEALKGVQPEELVVVAHSLGCIIWLHYLNKYPQTAIQKGYLVAPPRTDCGLLAIQNFYPLPSVQLKTHNYQIIGSNNDPYIPQEEFERLATDTQVPFHLFKDGGHINPLTGFGKWEWMEEECLKVISK
ncbi:serine hydrolase family protein [Candidatus Peregrinibacteria bacterium]|nr:MAG: serine hydrolase family protein [Candidatus Peregrinibacteria bacterium]